jgi:carboxyl-terminal processing protease
MEKLNKWVPLALAACLGLGIFFGAKLQRNAPTILSEEELDFGKGYEPPGKIEEILRYVDARYVDEVDRTELINNLLGETMHDLDPHSAYFTAEELRSNNEEMNGSFVGIGVQYSMIADTMTVELTLPNGPSEQAGVLAGDKIVSIDDSLVAGVKITQSSILRKLRKQAGSQVRLGIFRGKQKMDFTVTRAEIEDKSLDAAFMLNTETGYVRLNRFSHTTYEEFMKAVEDLHDKQGMKHLVLDLRQNGGGVLTAATNILSQFFKEKDKLLVYMEGKHSKKTEYKTSGRQFYNINKVAVLIDEGSASASEIVAGALQDWDRATIVGRRSFGKGLVQEQYPLSDGSALRLTIARYYTPSGRCIQKPYKGKSEQTYENEFTKRKGELLYQDSIKINDTTNYKTASGKRVYGGGGITPDIFVPIEAAYTSEAFNKLRIDIAGFAGQYAPQQKASLGTNSDAFLQNFKVDDAMMNVFWSYAASHGTSLDKAQKLAFDKETRKLLKARLARLVFSSNTVFYRALIQNDPMVEKALGNIGG